jgi:hypothetical protein
MEVSAQAIWLATAAVDMRTGIDGLGGADTTLTQTADFD